MSDHEQILRSKALEEEALAECDREAIHTPGSIYSCGALLAFNPDDDSIQYASANIDDYFAVNTDNLFSTKVDTLFDAQTYHDILNSAGHSSCLHQRQKVLSLDTLKGLCDVSLYRLDKLCVLEFLPNHNSNTASNLNTTVRWILTKTQRINDKQTLLQETCRYLKAMTGFDRVMAYQFMTDGSGEVLAESKRADLNPFLGLRFPKFDITPKARELFKRTAIRIIPDVYGDDVALLAANKQLPALDLSLAILRSTAAVHAQYLKNMNSHATMTLPIIVNGKLWGLFSHHHTQPRLLNPETLYASELLGQTLSLSLEHLLKQQADEQIKKYLMQAPRLISVDRNRLGLENFWASHAKDLQAILACDGVAYAIDDVIVRHACCPTEKAIQKIINQLVTDEKLIAQCDNLNQTIPECHFEEVAGVLILTLNLTNPRVYLLFFRQAIKQKVTWAGSPDKDIIVDREQIRLHPRASFKAYQESKLGFCDAWDPETLQYAEVIREALAKAIGMAVNKKKFLRDENSRLKIVVRELNHRVRNLLALVRSVSKQTMHSSTSIEYYVQALEQRILALSNANDLLTQGEHMHIDLYDLIDKELAPYQNQTNNINMVGPKLNITANVAPTLALVLHELTTNAVKYGALSVAGGQLNITWSLTDEAMLFYWQERGGPSVTVPKEHGFGSNIIENALAYEFSAKTELHFNPEGFELNFSLPRILLDITHNSALLENQLNDNNDAAIALASKHFQHILVVEDNFIVADDTKGLLTEIARQVTVVANETEALALLTQQDFDLAILDINLQSGTSLKIAKQCVANNMPVIYSTGYGQDLLQDPQYPPAPFIIKPIDGNKLRQALTALS